MKLYYKIKKLLENQVIVNPLRKEVYFLTRSGRASLKYSNGGELSVLLMFLSRINKDEVTINDNKMKIDEFEIPYHRDDVHLVIEIGPIIYYIDLNIHLGRRGPVVDDIWWYTDTSLPYWSLPLRAGLYTHIYEVDEGKALLSSLRKDSVFIDIGAAGGAYSARAAMRCEVHAFEPNPFAVKHLNNVLRNNNLSVDLHDLALSDHDGYAYLEWNKFITVSKISQKGETKVKLRRLDDLGLKGDVMKIDVEGHEIQVLHGGKNTIKGAKIILIEVRKNTEKDVRRFMREMGFRERLSKQLNPRAKNILFVKE